MIDAGAVIRPAGEARADPESLIRLGYLPRRRIDLFGTRFHLTRPRKNAAVRFFVAYVQPDFESPRRPQLFPRVFYKDLSLVWRSASHLVATDEEFWIGKGAVRRWTENGHEHVASVESTTDLPFEIQTALETINHGQQRVRTDEEALFLLLRNAPADRIEPYRDFTAPRRRAAEDPANRVHGSRPIVRFSRRNDPSSLRFTRGYEPDFRDGLLEQARSTSRLYGGTVRRFRFASTNRRIQYLFLAAPRHVWIIPPQANSTTLSSYGVRTVDVVADDDLFVPGFEYHYLDDETDPPQWVSQIPCGFAGAPAPFDDTRADASAWLERLPIIRDFRRTVLDR